MSSNLVTIQNILDTKNFCKNNAKPLYELIKIESHNEFDSTYFVNIGWFFHRNGQMEYIQRPQIVASNIVINSNAQINKFAADATSQKAKKYAQFSISNGVDLARRNWPVDKHPAIKKVLNDYVEAMEFIEEVFFSMNYEEIGIPSKKVKEFQPLFQRSATRIDKISKKKTEVALSHPIFRIRLSASPVDLSLAQISPKSNSPAPVRTGDIVQIYNPRKGSNELHGVVPMIYQATSTSAPPSVVLDSNGNFPTLQSISDVITQYSIVRIIYPIWEVTFHMFGISLNTRGATNVSVLRHAPIAKTGYSVPAMNATGTDLQLVADDHMSNGPSNDGISAVHAALASQGIETVDTMPDDLDLCEDDA